MGLPCSSGVLGIPSSAVPTVDEQNQHSEVAQRAQEWKGRRTSLEARAYSAQQREVAAAGRVRGAEVRSLAAMIRDSGARARDEGARTRDEAARVRDSAALVRDQAAKARDLAGQIRQEALRQRLLQVVQSDRAAVQKLLELDRAAMDNAHEAATRDREAASLDRIAADKDREAAERDRTAAGKDREAADKDREAAESESAAADADRLAAESDLFESDRYLDLAEDRLSRVDRLATMGRVVAGIAHEINNPLTALTTTLVAMDLELKGTSGEPANAGVLLVALRDAQLAASRIGQIMTDIRSWLREGVQEPARQIVNLEQVIGDAVRLTTGQVDAVARVVIDVQPTPPVWGVSGQLGQVLVNLLLNAAHAMTGPRDINEIRITARAVDAAAVIQVKDTGSGIAPEVLPHIFDPFFSTHEGSGGTGLGLSLCQRIVSMHSGTLTVASVLGSGTTFTITLPVGTQNTLQPPEPTTDKRVARLLLIDDDAIVARTLALLLSRRCDVTVAVNGEEGLRFLLGPGAKFDIVLCDVMMPVMNGLEMYERLREVAPEQAANLVFMSGGATTRETASFMAALPNVQLLKPFDPERLFRLIDERMGSVTSA